jgi:hypothetical protein
VALGSGVDVDSDVAVGMSGIGVAGAAGSLAVIVAVGGSMSGSPAELHPASAATAIIRMVKVNLVDNDKRVKGISQITGNSVYE